MKSQRKKICKSCLKHIDFKNKTYNACAMCDKCLCLKPNCSCPKFHPLKDWVETSHVFAQNQLEMEF
jgi:hypothetical protein